MSEAQHQYYTAMLGTQESLVLVGTAVITGTKYTVGSNVNACQSALLLLAAVIYITYEYTTQIHSYAAVGFGRLRAHVCTHTRENRAM